MKSLLNIEEHPLEPFLPINAKLLMLGSFPPQKKRWSMEFFYPNLQNDMWRIFGIIFFQNKDHFLNPDKKVFDKERIIDLLNKKGIALYDTASAVRRLQDNASDKFLEVVEQTDISLLLKQIPMCKAIVTTGQKATDIIREQIKVKEPVVGTSEPFEFEDRTMRLYRMPSSSRAYPLPIEKKSAIYRCGYRLYRRGPGRGPVGWPGGVCPRRRPGRNMRDPYSESSEKCRLRPCGRDTGAQSQPPGTGLSPLSRLRGL